MKPLDQTGFGYPNGNCEQAAILSLLELRFEDVTDWNFTAADPIYQLKLERESVVSRVNQGGSW